MRGAEAESELVHSLAISSARPSEHLSLSPSFQRCAFASWIRGNVCKKECCFFEKGVREDACKCGYSKTDHVDEAIKPEDFAGESWDRHRHVREGPTDAFGDISFGGLGQKTGKYVRVSADTRPEVLYRLLTEQWKLSPPNLLISVTGGAKNFYLKGRLKSMFHRGIIKVAQTTGAWILTGGTHTGVMKHVGQAVRDYALSSSSTKGQIVAIGVATWGVIHNRDSLVCSEGCFPAHYLGDVSGQGRLSCLDNNHTHFLLVDDGTHGRYGMEIELRSHLEKYISGKRLGNKGPGTLNVSHPFEASVFLSVLCDIVCVSFQTIYNAILNGTPCVLLEGSGRSSRCDCAGRRTASDPGHYCPHPPVDEKVLWPRLNMICHSAAQSASILILRSASRTSESQCWKRQLELAIAWNRVDIAESEIFTEESQWKSSDLHWAMFSALVGHKPQFVRLLLENGVSLWDFLQDEVTLCELYRQLPSCFFLRKLAKRLHSSCRSRRQPFGIRPRAHSGQGETISMTHVCEEVRHLLGSFTKPLYPPPPTAPYHFNMTMEETSSSVSSSVEKVFYTFGAWGFTRCSDYLQCVCVCVCVCVRVRPSIQGVFSKCHNSDEERAQKLLVRASPIWGRTTCLRLALEADDKSFVAQSSVQALLTQIWCGELSVDNPVWRVLVCMVFFPLIYTGFLLFRSAFFANSHTSDNDPPRLQQPKLLGCWSKLVCLYSSPQVKFYWNIVSYFAFLFLFAVVLMIDFHAKPSAGELLLYMWLISVVCEEVRQLFHDHDGFGLRKKAKMYIDDLWNILDVLSILLFVIGLAFRLTTELFYAGKILLCIDFVVFCLRLMAIFTISRTLGPKIIIVKRMMMDMFFFMFLLSIWVVAYGVAKQGILIDNDDRLKWIVRGAVYEPYLIIFGNFPTNIDNAAFDINSCTIHGTDPLKPKCPMLNDNQTPAFPEWLTIIMLCVYLLFANILLLNLLIAIFNFTFQEVQDNTDRIWKFQRYELIKEYHSRPAAPPPFIILSHLYLFIRHVVLCRPPVKYDELPQVEEEELLSWEALMKDRYLVSTQQEQSQSMERRILDTAQR
uniref:Transient receptor potential cation channel, subfamily M, member 2 n=1 Tax=Scophthalmus maximus TaxID=52904 RepID=A0A8D3ADL1_SCOMX